MLLRPTQEDSEIFTILNSRTLTKERLVTKANRFGNGDIPLLISNPILYPEGFGHEKQFRPGLTFLKRGRSMVSSRKDQLFRLVHLVPQKRSFSCGSGGVNRLVTPWLREWRAWLLPEEQSTWF